MVVKHPGKSGECGELSDENDDELVSDDDGFDEDEYDSEEIDTDEDEFIDENDDFSESNDSESSIGNDDHKTKYDDSEDMNSISDDDDDDSEDDDDDHEDEDDESEDNDILDDDDSEDEDNDTHRNEDENNEEDNSISDDKDDDSEKEDDDSEEEEFDDDDYEDEYSYSEEDSDNSEYDDNEYEDEENHYFVLYGQNFQKIKENYSDYYNSLYNFTDIAEDVCDIIVKYAMSYFDPTQIIPIKTFGYHKDIINMVIPINEDYIASCSDDQTIKIWSLEDGKCQTTLKFESDIVAIRMLSQKYIACLGEKLSIWNIEEKSLVREISSSKFEYIDNFFTYPSKPEIIIIYSDEKQIHFFNWETNKVLKTLDIDNYTDGDFIVTSDDTLVYHIDFGIIHQWDINSKTLINNFQAHDNDIDSIVIISENKIATATANNVKIWNINKQCWTCVNTLDDAILGDEVEVIEITVIENDYLVILLLESLKIYELSSNTMVREFNILKEEYDCVVPLPLRGCFLVTCCFDDEDGIFQFLEDMDKDSSILDTCDLT